MFVRHIQHVAKWCREVHEKLSGTPSDSEVVIEMVQREVHQNRRIRIWEQVTQISADSYGIVERFLNGKSAYNKFCSMSTASIDIRS